MCFTIGKALVWGDISKMQGWTRLSPYPRPLILRMPPPRALPPLNFAPGPLHGTNVNSNKYQPGVKDPVASRVKKGNFKIFFKMKDN